MLHNNNSTDTEEYVPTYGEQTQILFKFISPTLPPQA